MCEIGRCQDVGASCLTGDPQTVVAFRVAAHPLVAKFRRVVAPQTLSGLERPSNDRCARDRRWEARLRRYAADLYRRRERPRNTSTDDAKQGDHSNTQTNSPPPYSRQGHLGMTTSTKADSLFVVAQRKSTTEARRCRHEIVHPVCAHDGTGWAQAGREVGVPKTTIGTWIRKRRLVAERCHSVATPPGALTTETTKALR